MDELNLGEVEINPDPQSPPDPSNPQSAASGPNSGQTTNDDAAWPPEMVAMAAVRLLDVYCTRAYASPLTTIETTGLVEAITPVVRKYLGGPVSVEMAALGAVAMVVLPRHFTAARGHDENDSSGTGTEREREESGAPTANGRSLDALSSLFSAGTRPA